MSRNNSLFSSQYGFQKNHSCEHAIIELIGHILQVKNQGEQTASVFLDLSKAFDTLDHEILLSKLEQYGIRGTPLEWFRNFLTGRSLVTKVMTSPNTIMHSKKFNISYGTAMGSCLGPLLFLVFVNDIHHLELYSKIILFVDDTTIFNSHKSPQFLQYTIVHDLHLLMDWFRTNKLSLNLNKTVTMLFGDSKIDFNINIEGEVIPLVTHTKFLGVYLDNALSWQVHLNHVVDKIQTNKHLLSLGHNLLDSHTLKNI